MNYDYEQTEFSKALLAGVFAGITATVLSLLYNSFYREFKGFPLTEIINVPTIIFSLILLVTIAGLIFYLFHHYFRKGTIIYQAAGIMLTLLLIAATMYVQRSGNLTLSREFRELLIGVIIITGISSVIFVPFLFKHDYL